MPTALEIKTATESLTTKLGRIPTVKEILKFLRSSGFKTFSVAGLAGGAASALVKEFRNDDPTT